MPEPGLFDTNYETRKARFRQVENYLLKREFYCYEAMRVVEMGFPRWTEDIPTAGVRLAGQTPIFMFNPKFFDSLFANGERTGVKKLAFVLLHECYHLLLKHHSRKGDKQMPLWGIACDVVINEFLIYKFGLMDGLGFTPEEFQYWSIDKVYPDEFEALENYTNDINRVQYSADDIYDHLKANAIEVNLCEFVDDMDMDGDGDSDAPGGGGAPGEVDPDDEKALSDKVMSDEKVQERQRHAGIRARIRGYGYGVEFGDWLTALPAQGKYGVNWERKLSDYLNSSIVCDDADSWVHPSRKLYAMYPDIVLPNEAESLVKRQKVSVRLDISSSMDEETIKNLVKLLQDLPHGRADFDYALFNSWIHPISQENILAGKFRIEGGTSFQAIEDDINDRFSDHYPDIIVVLTDGECWTPDVKFPGRWLWVLTGSDRSVKNIGTCIML